MKKQIMKRFLKDKKGFTFIEVMFVALISLMVIGAILAGWIFTYRTWTSETERTNLRVDIMKALETLKKDTRLSSLTYMSFYPAGAGPYSAVSLPVAVTDMNGFFSLNASGEIDWDKTVIYHLYTGAGGGTVMRRTVFDPRDNTMTDDERYAQLAGVVSSGTGSGGSTTDTEFLENVDTFGISSLSPIIDFYDESSTPVKVGKIVFGWVKLGPGDHTVRFEITGKNDLSSGYDIGIDKILIEPSGSSREAEYYNSSFAPSGALTLSGGAANRVHGTMWDNDNYLEFVAGGTGNYMEISDHYDLWRESAFDSSSLNNVEKAEEEVRMTLDTPLEGEEGEITWFAYSEAGDSQQEGRDGTLPGGVTPPVTVRTAVTQNNIDEQGDLIRVSFRSGSDTALTIDKAYITKRTGASGAIGLSNQDPSALDVEEYHRHQQLFFRDAVSGNITEGVTIPKDSGAWSVWTAFPLRTDSDYLVSVYIADAASTDCKYWAGAAGTTRTYYLAGAEYSTKAGDPDWSGETPAADDNIYIIANIDIWDEKGSIESQIFDTTLSAPQYSEIKWSENRPGGTDILFKVRSSGDEYMAGAADWDSITGSGINPHSLSIGNGGYVQFLAELSAEPFWKTSTSTLSNENYVKEQVDHYPVHDFPRDGSGESYITGIYSTWIDDVEIDWPGAERMCTITGYVAKKNSYGQAKVTVDGMDTVKTLSVHVKVLKEIHGQAIVEENFVGVSPRNTGK